ncbi:MAG: Na+/H+ antiporter NhaA [Salinivirgaceae bacterium]|jgi:NhaA family Na+:H+ antiporter|nr:Na+/H+ antiporter NhaA [Salinivirgaceae bacterium]
MDYIKKPFEAFFKLESSGSILLFVATVLAIVIANSPLADTYNYILEQPLKIGFTTFKLEKPLILWVNDGLMAIFFFVIGLEIKREILVGELNSLQKASLPIFGAIGGMVIPVALFVVLNGANEGGEGWGIPMATDIAFTLGILQILGKRVPIGLKVFLTAFAIVDDIGAVLVIAIFYSGTIQWGLIGIAMLLLAVLVVFGLLSRYNKYIFFLFGFTIWVLFLKSGIHPTIAGILVAFTIPVSRKINTFKFYRRAQNSIEQMKCGEDDEPEFVTDIQCGALSNLQGLIEKTISPLQLLEHKLHGYVTYMIVPVFAFANAGVNLSGDIIPLSWNIALSMVFGKSIGIIFLTVLAIKLGWARLPENVTLQQIIGVAFLGGLGFTMALFISGLAYTDPILVVGSKTGILIGSFAAGLIGYVILRQSIKGRPEEDANDEY